MPRPINPSVKSIMDAIRGGKKVVTEGLPAGSQKPASAANPAAASGMTPGQRPPNPAQAGQKAAAAMQQVADAAVNQQNMRDGKPDVAQQGRQPMPMVQQPQTQEKDQKNLKALAKGQLPPQTAADVEKMVDAKLKELAPLNTSQGRVTQPAPQPLRPQGTQVTAGATPGSPSSQASAGRSGDIGAAPGTVSATPPVPESVDFVALARFTAGRYAKTAEILLGEAVDLMDPKKTRDPKINAWKRTLQAIKEGKLDKAISTKANAMGIALGMMSAVQVTEGDQEEGLPNTPVDDEPVLPDTADGKFVNPDKDPELEEPVADRAATRRRRAAIKAGMNDPESSTVTPDGGGGFRYQEVGSNPREGEVIEDWEKTLLEAYLDGIPSHMHKGYRRTRKQARKATAASGKEHVVAHLRTGHGEDCSAMPADQYDPARHGKIVYRVKPRADGMGIKTEGLFSDEDRKATLDHIFGA